MQAKPSQPSEGGRDKQLQRALLALALFEFPTRLHRRRLGWQIAIGDPLDAAVQELVNAGLLFCEGDEMIPTLPARHFDWLELP